MLKTAGRYTKILNYILVGLVFALLILQLLPFWSTTATVEGEEKTVSMSIQGYVWWTLDKEAGVPPTKVFEGVMGTDWATADTVLMPVIVVVAVIMTFFFGIKKPNRMWMNIVYQFCGIGGLIGYLPIHLFQMNGI